MNQFSREEMLIGKENIDKIKSKKVAVFGIGGVGTFVIEGLVRSGIEHFILVDNDVVSLTNLNRQLIATHNTIGKPKVSVMKERIKEINPNAEVIIFKTFFMPDTQERIINETVDYIVDAVDTVAAKIEIIEKAKEYNIPVISSMGTGNKLDPFKFEIADISKTSVCPLAKVMRKELSKRRITNVKVLYSKEEPIKPVLEPEENATKKNAPGSISFVPSVAGLMIASEVIKDIIK